MAFNSTNLPPIFVRAHYTLEFADRKYKFRNQCVSVFGMSGIRWSDFDPIERVGAEINVSVEVLSSQPFEFVAPAILTAECTTDANYLGVKFTLDPHTRIKLAETVRREGFYPTEYMRKYPRIPATAIIPSMPLRAIVATDDETLLSFDIANMSPGGILLFSENPKAEVFVPGSRIKAQVDPRGNLVANPFEFDGSVCRVLFDRNPKTRNLCRYLGVRFMRVSQENKQNLLEMLKAVLSSLQDSMMQQ